MIEIIMAILLFVELWRLYLYRRQLGLLKRQAKFIRTNDTNMELSTITHSKPFIDAIIQINKMLKKVKKQEYLNRKREHSFKESITSISHDLRTPLTSASGYLQMLNDDSLDKEKQKEYIKVVQDRVHSVNVMLNQLFEFTRLEAGEYQLDMERIDLNAVLCDTISMFYDELVHKNIEPNIHIKEGEIWVFGDTAAWTRVIENIIGNAIKYGQNSIGIVLEEKDGFAYLTISNKTDAIEQRDIDYIFERFYTTDLSRSKKSTGLGLAIAKEFILKMGGTIEAKLRDGVFAIIIQMKLYGERDK